MKSKMGHIQVNIDTNNLPFYQDLFNFLGWAVLYQDETTLGVGDENRTGLWFVDCLKEARNNYDGTGMNHLAIAVSKQSEVDEAVAYLQKNGVKALFNTPCHRPEFCHKPDETYYQVMFESPDHILLEVVFKGPIQK